MNYKYSRRKPESFEYRKTLITNSTHWDHIVNAELTDGWCYHLRLSRHDVEAQHDIRLLDQTSRCRGVDVAHQLVEIASNLIGSKDGDVVGVGEPILDLEACPDGRAHFNAVTQHQIHRQGVVFAIIINGEFKQTVQTSDQTIALVLVNKRNRMTDLLKHIEDEIANYLVVVPSGIQGGSVGGGEADGSALVGTNLSEAIHGRLEVVVETCKDAFLLTDFTVELVDGDTVGDGGLFPITQGSDFGLDGCILFGDNLVLFGQHIILFVEEDVLVLDLDLQGSVLPLPFLVSGLKIRQLLSKDSITRGSLFSSGSAVLDVFADESTKGRIQSVEAISGGFDDIDISGEDTDADVGQFSPNDFAIGVVEGHHELQEASKGHNTGWDLSGTRKLIWIQA